MTKQQKSRRNIIILAIVAVVCVFWGYTQMGDRMSYYAQSGEITIVEKNVEEDTYSLTVDQADGKHPGRYVLICTQKQYDAVEVGDVVQCDRMQSLQNMDGRVGNLYTPDGQVIDHKA